MSDYSELIARVRSPFALTEHDAQEIADALEAQAETIEKRIATLEELRNEYRRAITLLKEDTRARIAELEAMHQRDIDCIKRASIRISELERRAALKGEK